MTWWSPGCLTGGKFGALFVRENGTTTGKTKGQKPMIIDRLHRSLVTSQHRARLSSSCRLVRKACTWKMIELCIIRIMEEKMVEQTSGVVSRLRQRIKRRLGELNCQPMTNDPTFSQISPRRRVIAKHQDQGHPYSLLARFYRNHASSSETSA